MVVVVRHTTLSHALHFFLQLKSPTMKARMEKADRSGPRPGEREQQCCSGRLKAPDPMMPRGTSYPYLYERSCNFGCDGFCDRRFLRKDDKLLGLHWEASIIHGWINLKQLLDRPLKQKCLPLSL